MSKNLSPCLALRACHNSYIVRFKISAVEWQCRNEASIHRTTKHFLIDRKFKLSTVKLSTANTDHLQQQWTHQLLHRSALLPWPSMLKLASSPLASGAYRQCREHLSALHSTLGPCPPPRRNSYTVRFKVSVVGWQRKNEASIHRTAKHFLIEGGRNRKRKCRIP